jgi:hypothetical protein
VVEGRLIDERENQGMSDLSKDASKRSSSEREEKKSKTYPFGGSHVKNQLVASKSFR